MIRRRNASQFPAAFGESVGSNELTATTELAGYFFLRNDLGWRLAFAPHDYEIRISGDLYPFDPATPWLVGSGSGSAHAVQFVLQCSSASLVAAGGDPEVIPQAVGDRLMALHFKVGLFGKQVRSLLPRYYLWDLKSVGVVNQQRISIEGLIKSSAG